VSDRVEDGSAAELGASAVEYGILIAAIAALIVGLVFVVAQFVHDNYETTCTALHSQMAGDECPP
jgi:pilus assembly protein Flp/PilA